MPRKANLCSITDVSIDWFTATFTEGLKQNFAKAKCEHVMKDAEDSGLERSYTNRLGFVGDRIDEFFYGLRGDHLMVIGSGATADTQAPFFLGLADKVTRLDLAATLLDSDTRRDWSAIAFNQCQRDGRISSGHMKVHRIEGHPDGRTLYIGSRSSDRFVRIYDKTAESKGAYPPRTWRWEIEYKAPRSGGVAARLRADAWTTASKLDVLRSGLGNLRLNLPCAGVSSGWLPRRPHLDTTDETRLKYASRVIGPFLTNLLRNVGEERVTDALARSLLVRERVVSKETGELE
jgi:hypothetical protein